MDRILFSNYSDLEDYMIEHAEEGKMVYAVLFYDDATKLAKELLKHDVTEIKNITLHEADYDNYDKEFYVCLDSDMWIDISEAYHGDLKYHKAGYYIYGDPDAIGLISEDADFRVVNAGDGCSYMAEIKIGEEDKELHDLCKTYYNAKDDETKTIDEMLKDEFKDMERFTDDLKFVLEMLKRK